jgi:hypothetical protein
MVTLSSSLELTRVVSARDAVPIDGAREMRDIRGGDCDRGRLDDGARIESRDRLSGRRADRT